MKNSRALLCLGAIGFGVAIAAASTFAAQPAAALPNVTLVPSEMILLWPNGAPDETTARGPEHVIPDRPRPFDQIADVTEPTLAVCLPAKEKRNGTAMLVIPGGGLERLAIEHEGYEVAEWLNEQGISAFILKYRVPPRDPKARWKVGVQDAQRAMGIIRSRAKDWAIDANAIGSIGFSAGAEINIVLSVRGADRQYSRIDAADDVSSRPDFNIAIYGGGFANVKANELRPDIASRINADTPPMFIAHAFDDEALSSVILMNALKRAGVVSELHIFGAGAHGFGVRDSGLPVATWRELCLRWLAWQGFMDSAAVREYAQELLRPSKANAVAYPVFTVAHPGATLADAYAVQRRVVGAKLRRGDQVVGYTASVASTMTPASPADNEWTHGVLLKSGRIDASKSVVVPPGAQRPLMRMGIGYVIAVDIGSKLRVPRQAATSVEAIVPAIELRRGGDDSPSDATPQDRVAVNLGVDRFLVGNPVSPAADVEIDAGAIELKRDGKVFQLPQETRTKEARAVSLMRVFNQIIDQGHVLHRGDVIILGTGNATTVAESGGYVADYGRWGKMEFRID